MNDLNGDNPAPKYPLFHLKSRRFHLLLLLLTGFCMTSYMRSNLNVTMTCMINSTAVTLNDMAKTNFSHLVIHIPEQCRHANFKQGHINDYGGSLEWDSNQQKEMFKGTFWGSFATVLVSGYIADRISSKWLFQSAFAIYVLCTIIFPYIVFNFGFIAALGSRIVMGFGEGFVLPTINALVVPWYPATERSTVASIYTAGNQLAGLLGSPMAALLCSSRWKWPLVFYVCGIIGFIWSLLWMLTVSDTPSKCSHITEAEKLYLELNAPSKNTKKIKNSVPWRKIFGCRAVWAVFIAHYVISLISVLTQSYVPTYYKEVLYMKLEDNGLYTALPNFFLCSSKVLWGMAMDALRRHGLCSPTATCKISQWFSNISMAVIFLCLAFFVDCTRWKLGVFLMCLYGIGYSASISGFFTSLLSIAPMHTGTISSLAMLFGICGRMGAPDLVGFIRKHGTADEWKTIYITLAVMSLFCGIMFQILGSAQVQPWATETSHSCYDADASIADVAISKQKGCRKPLLKTQKPLGSDGNDLLLMKKKGDL
uniref:MFS domain-containing protein n=1 Tax=Syphacia muris TaxID=451379 RepID=A0A0N5AUK5_9BILA